MGPMNFILIICHFFALTLLIRASEGILVIKDAKLAITTGDGVRKVSESLSYPEPIATPLTLSPDDNLKMILTFQNTGSGKFIRPHQAFLMLTNEETDVQTPLIIQVRETGKSRLELDMKSAPIDLLFAPANYSLDLFIGTFSQNSPIDYHIATVQIDVPGSASPPPPMTYGPMPEIHHVFRDPERLPPLWFSYSFVIIVLTPWMILLGGWAILRVNLFFLTSQKSGAIAPIGFLASLVIIEWLFYRYWTSLNIFQTLLWLAGLSLIAFVAGQRALSNVQKWRLKRR